MPADYYVKLLAVDGTNPKIITPSPVEPMASDLPKSGYLDLAYSNLVNDAGTLAIKLPGDHDIVPLMVYNAQIEVWRRHIDPHTGVVDIAWYKDWSGLVKDIDPWEISGGTDLVTFKAVEDKFWLQDRYVEWEADLANKSKFTAAKTETIMKTLVRYNACADATVANGRKREGAITGLSYAADGAAGNTQDWACAYSNLLYELQKLSVKGGGDFDLIKTGAQTWEFRWYTGQRGTDRSATVNFSLPNGNMEAPAYRYITSGEKTATVVGGQGIGAARATRVRTGPNYSATHNVETFTFATQATTDNALDAAGDADLEELRALEELTFTALQTPACLYGLHYFVGDLVTAKFHSVDKAMKVVGVTVGFPAGQERIDVISQAVSGAGGINNSLASRVAQLRMGERA